MPCAKCAKKQAGKPLACPDKWKEGSREQSTGGRKLNVNKLLMKRPGVGAKCKTCKSTLHQPEAMYCQGCAYSKGICALCGVQVIEKEILAGYKQSKFNQDRCGHVAIHENYKPSEKLRR